jgi:hypothetical protein
MPFIIVASEADQVSDWSTSIFRAVVALPKPIPLNSLYFMHLKLHLLTGITNPLRQFLPHVEKLFLETDLLVIPNSLKVNEESPSCPSQ